MPNAKTPAPVSWKPSQYWEGVDGKWSTFDLRVGTPEQLIRVLPSTSGSAIWAVSPRGCDLEASPNCTDARGGAFDQERSQSWKDLGPYTLDLEKNLGYNESGIFGLDNVALGLSNATGGPSMDSQVVAAIGAQTWYTGILGLQQQPMNLSDTQPGQTFLSSLKTRNIIPSLSWAYTAGASYQSKGNFGSLTFGGSDTSRYIPNNASFSLAQDVQRDLVVGIQGITSSYSNGSVSSLLPNPTLAFIDSTVPYIYLPKEACKTFESVLGLVWNKQKNIYFVDDTLHQSLLSQKPRFTFRLGNDQTSGPTVNISLPYSSFDLVALPPRVPEPMPYFPIRRGNDSQITLGRAFLQEAYVITNYDQRNFSVSQAIFNDTVQPNIVPIPWNATASAFAPRHLDRKAIIGIGVGAGVFLLLVIAALIFVFLRWRQVRSMAASAKSTFQSRKASGWRASGRKAVPLFTRHEIGHQSIGELHNFHQVEIHDAQQVSGSGRHMNEIYDEKACLPAEISPSSPPASNISVSPYGSQKSQSDQVSPDEMSATVVGDSSISPGTASDLTSSLARGYSSAPSSKGSSGSPARLPKLVVRRPTQELFGSSPRDSLSRRTPSNGFNKPLPRLPIAIKIRPSNEKPRQSSAANSPSPKSGSMSPATITFMKHPSVRESDKRSPRKSHESTYAGTFDVAQYEPQTSSHVHETQDHRNPSVQPRPQSEDTQRERHARLRQHLVETYHSSF